MPHIKMLPVNWLDEAWAVSEQLTSVPNDPSGGLLGIGAPPPAIPARTIKRLQLAQDLIGGLLEYRVRVVHKTKAPGPDGEAWMYAFGIRDPDVTLAQYVLLKKKGVRFTPEDLWAVEGHSTIGRILQDGYATDESRRRLPLVIASIAGKSVSERAITRNRRPRRTAPNRLRDGKLRLMRSHPGESYKELLDRLQGEGIVERWDAATINWLDDDEELQSTATSTFSKWTRPK